MRGGAIRPRRHPRHNPSLPYLSLPDGRNSIRAQVLGVKGSFSLARAMNLTTRIAVSSSPDRHLLVHEFGIIRPAQHKGRRIDDWDTAEWMQNEKVAVAGDNHIRVTVDGQFKKLIVGRITTRNYPLRDRYPLRSRKNAPDTLQIAWWRFPGDVRPLQDLDKLSLCRCALE